MLYESDRQLLNQPISALPNNKSYSALLIIDKDDISSEYSSHAAWLGYIAVLTAEAEADYEKAKLDLDTLHAEKDTQARREFNLKNIKFTENMVNSWVNLDDEYIQAGERRIETLKAFKTLRAIEMAMKEKGQMLISLGATMRQEYDVTGLVSRLKE